MEDAWASNVVGDCFLRAGEKYVLVAHTSCRGYTMCVRRVRREFYASLSPTYASILLNRIIYARICIWNVTAEPKSAERPTNQARLRRLSPLIRVSFSPRVLFSSPTRSFIKRRDLTLRGISHCSSRPGEILENDEGEIEQFSTLVVEPCCVVKRSSRYRKFTCVKWQALFTVHRGA